MVIYSYIYLQIWQLCYFFSSERHECSTLLYLPMLELSAPTPPIVDYLFGTGLMNMFLWTVGSFYVFGEQLDLTCFFASRIIFLEKHTDFHVDSLFAKIHHAPSGRGFYFFEIPIWERLLFFGDSHFENLSASKCPL